MSVSRTLSVATNRAAASTDDWDIFTLLQCRPYTGLWYKGPINPTHWTPLNRIHDLIVCSPPDAPTIDSITPGDRRATIAFTPGIDNGSPAYSFKASCFGVGGRYATGTASPITVTSLYKDDTYECFITATNIIGTSPASATSAPFVVGAPATFAPPPYRATPVPTSPLWLLGIMAGLLSLVGFRNLHKT